MLTAVFVVSGWLVAAGLSGAEAATSDDDGEKRLFHRLFENYEPAVRPRRNPSDAVDVDIEFELNQIKGLDEKSEILYSIGFVEAQWNDDYMQWDPANHSNIQEIVVPPSRVWLPDFGVENSAETFYEDTYFNHFRVSVSHRGRLRWSFGGVFETSCDLDTTFYPFDFQTCSIRIENWAYGKQAVNLRNGSSSIHTNSYHPHGIWLLPETRSYTDYVYFETDPTTAYPRVVFELTLQRKPRYYAVNIMIPCLFLTSIALLVFILPPESGEKVSLGVTILLSFSVFQFVIADNTPVNSDCTPLLGIFVAVTMGMSTLSVITTVIVLHLHHQGVKTPVPAWIRTIAFRYVSRVICLGVHEACVDQLEADDTGKDKADDVNLRLLDRHDKYAGSDKNNGNVTSHQSSTGDEMADCRSGCHSSELRQMNNNLDRVTSYVNMMSSRIRSQDAEQAVIEDWQALAKIVDRLLFYATILLIILAAVIVLILGQTTPRPRR